jgi:type I restriction enzyme R subunit
MGELATNNFAIIIDEAHSSTSGNTLRKLNEALYKELTEETDEEEQTKEERNKRQDRI